MDRHVEKDGWTYGQMDGCKGGRADRQTGERMDSFMYSLMQDEWRMEWMHRWMLS